ncbi:MULTISPECIES: hypothetical protein [Citrobacter]|nr:MULTISPECIES: hypothetical protein [Citrobacter]KLV77134.1 hypothetical protein SK39_04256 [Citrobacter sp. BIDMC107]MDT3757858.1 hypothetical protein [Citrobacter freundii complex sp. 2023EL-00962]QAR64984.1 hypothetical protein C3B53_10355 [Citrobacter sp. SL156]AKL17031.1 hypothetical protein AB180_08400 [Citrobacter freundii]AKL59120.1 hypothetical protein AB183_25520 [Citrobacter freundii]
MITALFFTLCAFAAFHFIYERILQPSLRLSFRNELFEIRDKVRNEIISGNLSPKDMKAAVLIHDGLNNTINRLHLLTIGNKIRAEINFARNPEIKERVNKHAKVLFACENEELLQAVSESVKVMDKALVANNLPFLLYIAPVVLSFMLIGKVFSVANSTATKYLQWFKAKQFEKAILLSNDGFLSKVVVATA